MGREAIKRFRRRGGLGWRASRDGHVDRAFHRKRGLVCFFMARTPHRARLAAPGTGASRGGFVRRRADRATATRSYSRHPTNAVRPLTPARDSMPTAVKKKALDERL
jgi:hypothetical protein